MDVLNEVLYQLREADRFARGEPQLRRLAVVLLDNLLEVQIRRHTNWLLLTDRTTWFKGVRQHNKKRRARISRFHFDLLAFAVEKKIIRDDEAVLLRFGHRVRNAYYHRGGFDELDSEIAILLFYRIIRERFPAWKTAMPFHTMSSSYVDAATKESVTTSGFEQVTFGFEPALNNQNPFGDEYWRAAIPFLLTYKSPKSLPELMAEKLHGLVDDIDHLLTVLRAERGFDWNHVLTRYEIFTTHFLRNLLQKKRLTNLATVLNIYAVILSHEDDLLDIAELKEREAKFHELLRAHPFTTQVLSAKALAELRLQADELPRQPEAEAIYVYLGIEERLAGLRETARACVADLEAYSDRD